MEHTTLFDISIALAGLAVAFDEGQQQRRFLLIINHFLQFAFHTKNNHSLVRPRTHSVRTWRHWEGELFAQGTA